MKQCGSPEARYLLTTAAVMEGDASAVKIGAAEDITCVRTEGETAGLSIVYDIPDAVKAPVNRWELAGKMDIYSEGEYVYSKDLYYLEDVKPGAIAPVFVI